MNKLEKLADRLQASIDFATEHNEDFEASSWNYQEGVLLNHNEAKLVVELVKKLTLTDVVASVLCVSDEIDCLNITKGKKYTLIESDNVFFRVVNDLGNEQLYYNYRFKRL